MPSRDQKALWISEITQSLGVSLLLRAYQNTHDERYSKAASNAFRWLKLPISSGGVAITTSDGTWFEEYPDAKNPSHVLNGHMWALFGIWDYFRATGDPTAKQMFLDGLRVIKGNIEKYDVGYWAVYVQTNRVDCVNGSYMAFIIQQLKVLHAISGDQFFDEYSRKWGRYQQEDAFFCVYGIKAIFRISNDQL